MRINERKSTLSVHNLEEEELDYYRSLYPYEVKDFDAGLKYLGFHLKPNCYKKEDWLWLIEKLEKRLNNWSFRWLSRAGHLILVKLVLEAIPFYWMSLAWIPKGVLEKERKICFKFLWVGTQG
jgi:hypothetical protein